MSATKMLMSTAPRKVQADFAALLGKEVKVEAAALSIVIGAAQAMLDKTPPCLARDALEECLKEVQEAADAQTK